MAAHREQDPARRAGWARRSRPPPPTRLGGRDDVGALLRGLEGVVVVVGVDRVDQRRAPPGREQRRRAGRRRPRCRRRRSRRSASRRPGGRGSRGGRRPRGRRRRGSRSPRRGRCRCRGCRRSPRTTSSWPTISAGVSTSRPTAIRGTNRSEPLPMSTGAGSPRASSVRVYPPACAAEIGLPVAPKTEAYSASLLIRVRSDDAAHRDDVVAADDGDVREVRVGRPDVRRRPW